MTDAHIPDETVTVIVQWRETCIYEKKVEMTQAQFDAWEKRLDAGHRERYRAQSELFTAFNLNGVQPHDWEDEEIDTFEVQIDG